MHKKDGNRICVGLATIAFRDHPVEEVVKLAAEWGYSSLELWGKPSHTNYPVVEKELFRLRDAARDADIDISVIGSYANPSSEEWEVRCEEDLAIAEILGAGMMRIWAGDRGSDSADKKLWERCVTEIQCLGDRIIKSGIIICVERHENTLTDTTDAALKFITDVDRENVGLNWQTSFAPGRMEVARDLDILLPHTVHVHAQTLTEYPKPLDRPVARAPLRSGVDDWSMIVSKLMESGYEGEIMVEFVAEDSEKAAADDFFFLNECLTAEAHP